MKVKNISFPTYLEDSQGIENSYIDIFVEVDDGYTYIVTLRTAKNTDYLMNKEEKNYFEPGDPFIIVKELTMEIIEKTIKVYASQRDGYWLKWYYFAGRINKTVFDRLQAEDIVETLDTMSFNIGEELEKLKGEYRKELDKLKSDYTELRKEFDEL